MRSTTVTRTATRRFGAHMSTPALVEAKNRLIARRELELQIGLKRSAIYDRLDPTSPRYDPQFPKPVPIGGTPAKPTAVRWLAAEVDAWIQSRVALRAA